MKKLTKEAVVFALFFTIVMVLMKVFIGGETIWSVFYQRHAGLTYTHGTTDYLF